MSGVGARRPADFSQVARQLLGAFKRRRPLRGGSLITTVFGDSLAARQCEVSLAGLIGLLAPFGLTERLVRTSIGRLAQDDWMVAHRVGRLSYYRLSAAGEERFAAATRRIYAAPKEQWRGSWTTLIVPAETDRPERERIRDALRWSGFGQPAPGVYVHPEMDSAVAARLVSDDAAAPAVLALQARSESVHGDRRMIEHGWDLDELERRYTRFISGFAPALQALKRGPLPDPQHCFHIRTLLIHEYRKVHLLDPQLPRPLLPRDWAGNAAYELCQSLYRQIADRSDDYVQSMLTTRNGGALPPPAAEIRLRFAAPGEASPGEASPSAQSVGQDSMAFTQAVRKPLA